MHILRGHWQYFTLHHGIAPTAGCMHKYLSNCTTVSNYFRAEKVHARKEMIQPIDFFLQDVIPPKQHDVNIHEIVLYWYSDGFVTWLLNGRFEIHWRGSFAWRIWWTIGDSENHSAESMLVASPVRVIFASTHVFSECQCPSFSLFAIKE